MTFVNSLSTSLVSASPEELVWNFSNAHISFLLSFSFFSLFSPLCIFQQIATVGSLLLLMPFIPFFILLKILFSSSVSVLDMISLFTLFY